MKRYLFLLFAIFSFKKCFALDHIIISQIQVSGSSSTDEFIELYNPTNDYIDLCGYKIQKISATGVSYNIISSFPEESVIKPFSYFLFTHENFSFKEYIKPDYTYSKFSLAKDNSIVLIDKDKNEIDKVNIGNGTFCAGVCLENLNNYQSYIRKNDYYNYNNFGYGLTEKNCDDFDSQNNIEDFILLEKSSPRNSDYFNKCYGALKIEDKIENNTIQETKEEFNNISVENKNSFINIFPTINGEREVDSYNLVKISNMNLESGYVLDNEFLEDFDSKEDEKNKKEEEYNLESLQFLENGKKVNFSGIVVSLPNENSDKYFYINGAQIYSSSASFPNLKVGDKIFVDGEISSNYGEKRIKIKNANNIKVISNNNDIEIVNLIESGDNFEENIAKLVFVSGVIYRKNANKVYLLSDEIETEIYFTEKLNDKYKELKVGNNVKIIGILNKRNENYRIIPRNINDISFLAEDNEDDLVLEEEQKQEYIIEEKEDIPIIVSNNRNFSYLKYIILGFSLLILFLIIVICYKKNIFSRIKIYIFICLDKLKNKINLLKK